MLDDDNKTATTTETLYEDICTRFCANVARKIFNKLKVAENFFKACSYCATHEITSLLWNTMVHYRIDRSPPLVPFLSQINTVHTLPSFLFDIRFNVIFPSLTSSFK
jgi:hypothetical protein